MSLPPLQAGDPIIAQRLHFLTSHGNATINRGLYAIRCESCGFSGPDRSFSHFPDASFRTPEDLRRFLDDHAREQDRRKCPECNAMAALEGLRLFVMSGSLQRDLVVDLSGGTASYALVSPDGKVQVLHGGDSRILTACLDSLLRAGQFLLEMRPDDVMEATALLRVAADARTDHPESQLALARVLLGSGQGAEAMERIQLASRQANSNLNACLDLGALLGELAIQQRDSELLNVAFDWYDQALHLDSGNPAAHLAVGRLFLLTGNTAEAGPHLERAARSEPHAMDAAYNLGLLALRTGRADDAAQMFTRLAEAVPDDPDYHRMRAWALAKSGRVPEALEALDRAEQIEPDSEETSHFRELITAGGDLDEEQ